MQGLQEIVERTSRLIAIPSVSSQTAELHRVIQAVAEEVGALPGVRLHHYEEQGFPALVVGFGESRQAEIVFNAHLDVVPARPEQFVPQLRDGRIYGRGAQDMKAAGAVFISLIRDLAGQPQAPSFSFQFVTDEEVGGDHGSLALLRQGFSAELFIAGEPTDLLISNQAKGIYWLVVRQPGCPAHGSRPWEGDNPILALHSGLTKLLARFPVPAEPAWRTTITPSAINGGDALNRIPASCELKLDIRYVPREDRQALLAEVQAAFPRAEVVIIHHGSALETDEEHPLVRRVAQAQAAVTGEQPRFYAEHFGSDARFYGEIGRPALCWGPVGAGLHSHEEWVSVESLGTYYAALRKLVGL